MNVSNVANQDENGSQIPANASASKFSKQIPEKAMSSSQPVGTHQGDPDLIDSLEQLLIKELTNLKIKTKESKPLIIAPKR